MSNFIEHAKNMSDIILALVMLCIGFWVGSISGEEKGAIKHFKGEWTCEVALGEVHCGPVEGD